jgi:type-F conjugative transfer system pilin assembly protein TrbC
MEEKIMLFTLKALLLFSLLTVFEMRAETVKAKTVKAKKVDLQKIYNEGKNFASARLIQDNQALKAASSDQRCYGSLEVKKPCAKKDHNQKLKNVVQKTEQTMVGKELKKDQKIIIFVSLSMPKNSLMVLMQEAEKYQAILVMRGLKDDSFKQTAIFLKELNENANIGGIEINPKLFEEYTITQVPTFVLVKNGQEIARLKGNVSLDFAHLRLSEV